MARIELNRPTALDETEWLALVQLVDRIARALTQADWALVVGSTKELCETVAKQVLEARGELVSNKEHYEALLTKAHRLLERQPGVGLAADPPIRDIATAVKRIAIEVGTLRRTHGTGHGRVVAPDVIAEHSELAVDAAVLWCRWALRRLDVIVEGRAVDLLRDLREGHFHRGDLRRRLVAADLAGLGTDDQRRLGLAVGRRASRGTFNVLDEGTAAAIDGPWTDHYRRGVVEGTFIDDDGFVRTTGQSAKRALEILGVMDPTEAREVVQRIETKMLQASRSYAMTAADVEEAVTAIEQMSERMGPIELRLDLGLLASGIKGIDSI